MAIFLKSSEMWDRALGGNSNLKQIPHWFANFAYVLVGLVFKILFRYKVSGRENLRAFKDKCGVVVVSNHTSFLDVAFSYIAARPSQFVRLMGRDNLFNNAGGLSGQILSRVGAFPIKRNSADRLAIKRAAKMLKTNQLVGIMPEGTRRGKGSEQPKIHAGAAFIAKMGNAPILPMCVRNAEKIKQKGKFLRFPKVEIEYGKPVCVPDFDFLPKPERLEACTWFAMRESFALVQNCSPEDVDMKALFPTAKDYTLEFKKHPVCTHEVSDAISISRPKKGIEGINNKNKCAETSIQGA